ncbi:VCBS repeat-containing protein [Nocardioides sp. BGMRC 2183]|nr:VCBS repeat-containing protein [Nocardioides sp. BGMRC 2183]
MPLPRATLTITGALLVATGLSTLAATPSPASAPAPVDQVFERIDVDHVDGASFTVVGEVFPGEQNIVTSGYGALSAAGTPTGGGTVHVYRPGSTLADWTEIRLVEPDDGLVFPNQATIHDVDGDGDNDVITPYGYFFDTDPSRVGGPLERSGIAWWENAGVDGSGHPLPFERHDIITDQPWSYHSAIVADLDDDGIDDLLSTGEQGRSAANQADDAISLQFFAGLGDGAFATPTQIADVGGSIPVVYDVDGDGRLDIISSQYFDVGSGAQAEAATFVWLERGDDAVPGLGAGDFTPHTIATRLATPAGRGVGPGFQIRPVPNLHGDGEVAWVGTNHTNRCTLTSLPPEEVFELVPGPDPTEQWRLVTLSNPSVAAPACPADYPTVPIFPGEEITSRFGYGQAAPGVFGYGDVDGDGDVDLLVSGDGDRRLFWIEQVAAHEFVLHTLTAPGEEFGQSGGAVVADLDDDGNNELVFSSFDTDTVALWRRATVEDPLVTATTLSIAPRTPTVRPGRPVQVTLTLEGAAGGGTRGVTASLVTLSTGTRTELPPIDLTETTPGSYQGTLTLRPRSRQRLSIAYAGTELSPLHRDAPATTVRRLDVVSTVSRFGRATITTRRSRLAWTAKVAPAARRAVVLQTRVCKRGACTWRSQDRAITKASGMVRVVAKLPKGTSKWRLSVRQDSWGLAAVSGVRTVRRR